MYEYDEWRYDGRHDVPVLFIMLLGGVLVVAGIVFLIRHFSTAGTRTKSTALNILQARKINGCWCSMRYTTALASYIIQRAASPSSIVTSVVVALPGLL